MLKQGSCCKHHSVIPGRRAAASPESITTAGDHRFRAPSQRSGPGMTVEALCGAATRGRQTGCSWDRSFAKDCVVELNSVHSRESGHPRFRVPGERSETLDPEPPPLATGSPLSRGRAEESL